MPIGEFIAKEVISAAPEQSVAEVANLMRANDVGAILVTDADGRPSGIITDRDIVLRCVCEGRDCNSISAAEIMTDSVETVDVHAGLMDIIKCMKESEVRRVPVVDEEGRAVGLVSFGDVLELLVTELNDLAVPATPDIHKIDKDAA